MRVIRPESMGSSRRRPALLALTVLAAGVLSVALMTVGQPTPLRTGVLATTAAVGIGVGLAWLVRAIRSDPGRRISGALVTLLSATFDDSYTLVVAPRLSIREGGRLDGLLVGPGGVRALTARDWVGHYRLRGRTWEFDSHGRHGWIVCRTNPSLEANKLAEGVGRWMREAGLPDLTLRAAVVFPHRHSQVVLEEPADEIVTTDNAPWWANTFGRVRRIDPATSARVLEAVLDAAEPARRLAEPRTGGQQL